ncbi:MAG TPA: hypothetical protein VK420_20675 [Longimicrobium sp.]|nr:hypothetical protein [Longimicrobium sp.]
MTHRRSTRLFLLIAALAHVLGGELGALLHRAPPLAPPEVTVFAPGSGGDQAPAPEHPRDCAFCQTLADGALALPERGIALRAGFADSAIPAAAPGIGRRLLAASPSLPRGPPSIS